MSATSRSLVQQTSGTSWPRVVRGTGGSEVGVEPVEHAGALVDARRVSANAMPFLGIDDEDTGHPGVTQCGVHHLSLGGRCRKIIAPGCEQRGRVVRRYLSCRTSGRVVVVRVQR